jgi:hypothetical protein
MKHMSQSKQVPMMISLPPEARDRLRILAAEQNMRNPTRVTAAASIARELILEGIEKIESMEAALTLDINCFDGVLTQELERGIETNETAD